MTKRMLIDAAHAEETRVAVVDGGRIEELDFEIASKRQLRGNIYLAKVVRVEPSLQAAFVEYGGNRHGFLAFNEIHPDYFQIPQADREALLREAAEPHHDDEDEADAAASDGDGEDAAPRRADDEDDAIEKELDRRRQRMLRKYKIQEVIRRRQIMLVQVVKEERGNKGAALTTYLSLAGRYCVLMPNTARGGGISRKITNAADRKRLKSATSSLDVPHGMGLIVRTAGASRTKAEIKRDYDYLLRMWENIRETTLQSIAPSLIYAEEDLVKRAVRDMFDKEFDSIQVEGEAGYREARDFMRMIMPSQAKKVVHYKDPTPLFVRHRVEDQIGQIHSPVVPLRSGGYLVINQTEALVAIDVNSGKATRERNIEQTALKTNTEAAEEAARQLRLRDLAGLIVIDFIDMDEGKNNRSVEKRLKDCLRDDRARVQMGKISGFGLMEISRQRRRMGVLEGSTHVCPHCQGAGRIRSTESAALEALRAVEVEAVKGGPGAATLRLPTAVGLYVLNSKRAYLLRLEQTHGLTVTVALDDALAADEQEIERTETREGGQPLQLEPPVVAPSPSDDPELEAEDDDPAEDEGGVEEIEADGEGEREPREAREPREDREGRGGRRRRRGRGRGRDDEREAAPREGAGAGADAEDDADETEAEAGRGPEDARSFADDDQDSEARRRRRRRGRRGGRRTREDGEASAADPYAWRRADRPQEGADAYAWRDPHGEPRGEAIVQAAGDPQGVEPVAVHEAQLAQAGAESASAPPAPGPQVAAAPGADPYGWSEGGNAVAPEPAGASPEAVAVAEAAAEAPPAKPKRVRAPRKSAATKAAEAQAAADAATLAQAEPAAPSEAPAMYAPVIDAPATEAAAPAVLPATQGGPAPDVTEAAAPDEAAPPVREDPVAEVAQPHGGVAHGEPDLEREAEPAITAQPPAAAPLIASDVVVAAEPDPAEIAAPPAAPRRGWWRRGK